MAVPIGLLFTGLILKTILGAVVVVFLVIFLWKAAKVADAYAQKLKTK